jgi:hypothetical protein
VRVPQAVANDLFPWREHVTGRVITLTRKLLAHLEVTEVDLSDELLDVPREGQSDPLLRLIGCA